MRRNFRQELGLRIVAATRFYASYAHDTGVSFSVPEGEIFVTFQMITDRKPLIGYFVGCRFRNLKVYNIGKNKRGTKDYKWSSMFTALSTLGHERDSFYCSPTLEGLDDIATEIVTFIESHITELSKYVTLSFLEKWICDENRDRKIFHVLDETWLEIAVLMVGGYMDKAREKLTQAFVNGRYSTHDIAQGWLPEVITLCRQLGLNINYGTASDIVAH